MTRGHLPRPIRDVIDVPLEESETAARWRAIERRTSGPAPRRKPVWIGGAAVAIAAAAVALLSSPPAPGPLALRDGSPLASSVAAEGEPRAVALDDGSTIQLSAGARMRVLDNSRQRMLTLLESGTARYEVQPGTGRTWIVEAGIVTVEVTGTVFEVARGERGVSVHVEEGRVLVRGEGLPDRVRALGAGERVEVRAIEPAGRGPTPELRATGPTDAVSTAGPEPLAEPEPRAPTHPPTPRRGARDHDAPARDGDHEAPARDTAPTDLLAEADAARRAGRIDEALELLARAAEEPGPSGAIASLTRGRLLLQQGRAREAVADLERARAGGLPRSTEELALALLARAHHRAGEHERARVVAAEYRTSFPSGRLLDDLEPDPR